MMDGQLLMQGAMLVRTAIDAAKAVANLVPQRKRRDEIPVYRMVSRDQLLRERHAGLAAPPYRI